MSEDRIAIVDGIRSPFAKSWTSLNGLDAVALSTHVTRELLFKNNIPSLQEDNVTSLSTVTIEFWMKIDPTVI